MWKPSTKFSVRKVIKPMKRHKV